MRYSIIAMFMPTWNASKINVCIPAGGAPSAQFASRAAIAAEIPPSGYSVGGFIRIRNSEPCWRWSAMKQVCAQCTDAQ